MATPITRNHPILNLGSTRSGRSNSTRSDLSSSLAERVPSRDSGISPSLQSRSVTSTPSSLGSLDIKQKSLENHKIICLVDPKDRDHNFALKANGLVGSFAYASGDVTQGVSKIVKFNSAYSQHFQGLDPSVVKSSGILSLTNASSAVTGYLAYKNGSRMVKSASKVNDRCGEYLGKISLARAPFEAASGVISLPNSIMTIGGITAAGKTALASKILTLGSSVASGAYLMALAGSSSVMIYENRKTSKEFVKAVSEKNPDKAIEALLKRVILDDDKLHEIFEKTLKNYQKDKEKTLSKVVDGQGFILEDSEYQTIDDYVKNLAETQQIQPEEVDEVKALMISEIKKKYAARQQSFIRVFGQNTLSSLIDLYKEKDIEKRNELKTEIINQAKSSIKQGLLFQSVLLASVVAGTGLIVLGNIFSAGALYLAVQIGSLFTAALFAGIDFYALCQTMRENEVNKKEKIVSVTIAVLMIASIVAANVFSGGTVGFVMLGVSAALLATGVGATVFFTKKQNHQNIEEATEERIEIIRVRSLIEEMKAFEERRQARLEARVSY